jgi:DNA-binding response OmpR family regulator
VTTLSFGDVVVDFTKMQVSRAGHSVALTAHEMKLLRFFLENADRVLTREELLNDVWGYNFYPSTRTVDNQILKLRQKLEADPANPAHFRTVHGVGYKFVHTPAG